MNAQKANDIEHLDALLSTWQAPVLKSPPTPPSADRADDELPAFDVRWAAGLFDGEGCIHLVAQRSKSGKHATHHLRVCITQNHLPVLQHFQRGMGVGGHIYAVAPRAWHSRPVYSLNFATAQSIALLQRPGPHLVRKRDELALARRFWTECEPGNCRGRKGMSAEVRALREWIFWQMKRPKRGHEEPVEHAARPIGGASRVRGGAMTEREEAAHG